MASVVFRRWCLSLALVSAAAAAAAAGPAEGFRALAPGTLTVIPADRSADDLVQRADLLEVTAGQADLGWKPKQSPANTTFVERAKNREFTGAVWCLEFAFKPPRTIDVDVPVADGKMRRKRVWYLVYRVKNVGGRQTAVDPQDSTKRVTEASQDAPVRFVPHFVLESLEPLTDAEGLTSYRAYLDRVVPSAMAPIQARERVPGRLYDSASMTTTDIAAGEERWGVAVWEDIDPRIDFFSIYVRGLTNAMRWRQIPGSKIGPDDPPGLHMEHALESLRLDFWRPGDEGDAAARGMQVGFRGMFERMTIGSRLLEIAGRPGLVNSRPDVGLEALGLGWSDLLEPDAGGGMPSLLPLEAALRKLAALPDPAARAAAVQDLFGDLGIPAIEGLSRAVAGPADAARRAALDRLGLKPDQVAAQPLESLAAIVRALESAPTYEERVRMAEAFFGGEGRRIDQLAKGLSAARAAAVLEELDARPGQLGRADALAAFTTLQKLLETHPQQDQRNRLLQGLLGPRGPQLYAAAAAVHEGIDHEWVFRYERDVGGP